MRWVDESGHHIAPYMEHRNRWCSTNQWLKWRPGAWDGKRGAEQCYINTFTDCAGSNLKLAKRISTNGNFFSTLRGSTFRHWSELRERAQLLIYLLSLMGLKHRKLYRTKIYFSRISSQLDLKFRFSTNDCGIFHEILPLRCENCRRKIVNFPRAVHEMKIWITFLAVPPPTLAYAHSRFTLKMLFYLL